VSELQSALFMSDSLAAELPKLAAKHKICHIQPFYATMIHAELLYWGGKELEDITSVFKGKPDSLDRLPPAINKVITLLQQPVNKYRLDCEWAARGNDEELLKDRTTTGESVSTPTYSAFARRRVDDLILLLLECQGSAVAAHKGPGPHQSQRYLTSAYSVLAAFWLEYGPAKFTNTWQKIECGKLAPESAAACFLYDMFFLICPKHDNLARQLRYLMAETVRIRNLG